MGWQESKGTHPQPTSQTTTSDGTTDSVNVDIGGKSLSVRTDRAPSHVHELADYIDTKLQDLRSNAPAVPLDKLLMMVSMTVAEELFETRDELDQLQSAIRERVSTCLSTVDDAESDLT